MRILHTSDWHLGQFFYAKNRANEHQQFLDWLITQVKLQHIDAIIVAGDIFDTGAPPSYARELYFDFIAKLQKENCQLVVVAGNHDSVAMLGESQKLLANFNSHIIANVSDDIDQQVFYLNDQQGNKRAVICAVPFVRPRDVIKSQAGQSANEKQQSLHQAIKAHYHKLFQRAQQLATQSVNQSTEQSEQSSLPIIATGHLTALGVKSSDSVRDIYIGTLEAFPASDFPEADYIALGHIHQPQKIAKTEHIRYCGSPIPLSFDELNYDKKVLIAEFSKGQLNKVEEVVVPRFQAIASIKASLEMLEQQLTELMAQYCDLAAGEKLWLAIEIESQQYLTDLSVRVEKITEQFPVEVLFIKRQSTRQINSLTDNEKVTLAELNVEDVFNARLEQEQWLDESALEQKARLNQLFLQVVEQVRHQTDVDQVQSQSQTNKSVDNINEVS